MVNLIRRKIIEYKNTDGNLVTFIRGDGCSVFDASGGQYIDFVLGYGPVVLGHSVYEFNEFVCRKLNNGIHMPGYTTGHASYIESLFKDDPESADCSASIFKSSSEAVAAAMRVAAIYSGRKGVIRCGYSGWLDAQLAYSPQWHFPPHVRGSIRHTSGFRGVEGSEMAVNWVSLEINELEKLLEENAKNIGCMVFDAFQLSFCDVAVFAMASRLCKSYGVIVILDETKTSGRCGATGIGGDIRKLWDIRVLGKAIANGAPLSLTIFSQYLADVADDARVGGTYSKELLSIYCAEATLNIMRENDGYKMIGRCGNKVSEIFNDAASAAGLSDVVYLKPLFGGGVIDISFLKNDIYKSPLSISNLQCALVDEGVVFLVGHPSFISLAHCSNIPENIGDRFYSSLSKWKECC